MSPQHVEGRRFLALHYLELAEIQKARWPHRRAMLEEKLSKAERKERRARRWTYGMWIAVFALGLFGAIGHAMVSPEVKPFARSLVMLAYGLFWLALLRLGIYLAFERRALDVARADVRDAMILELSRQVEAIARRLDDLKPAGGS